MPAACRAASGGRVHGVHARAGNRAFHGSAFPA